MLRAAAILCSSSARRCAVPAALLRMGWNTVEVTVAATPKPLQLVETEIALTPP